MSLGIGVIGIGGLGHFQATTFDGFDGVSLVGAADVSAEARQEFETTFDAPAYQDYRELLFEHGDELDAAAIVTPHTLHYEQAMACLERGLHVLIEKPMVTDVAHAVELVETAAERGVVLQVGYQRHFHPAFEEVRRICLSGRLGQLHAVNCYLGQDWINLHHDSWRTNPTLSGGGQLYDTGSHLLDALLWTTGTVPTSVTAQIDFAEARIDVNSALAMRLDRDGDTVIAGASISGDGMAVSPSEGYFYWGTAGRLAYTDGRIQVTEREGMTYETDVSGVDFQTLNSRKLENFVDSIEGTVEPAVPGEVGLQVTALTEAAFRAVDEGRPIQVPPLIEAARPTTG